jgi:RimJ/RimL family protein N-acetyltransferase
MINLIPFTASDFDLFISWIDSEELLITIAGTDLTYPLTADQLSGYLKIENSHAFTILDTASNKKIGHAELVLSGKGIFKIDKLLVGDRSLRGKGLGQAIIHELLHYAFKKLEATTVELNVFDWNTAGIRCYEKCGFVMNPQKKKSFQAGAETWTAINMTIEKQDWTASTLSSQIPPG